MVVKNDYIVPINNGIYVFLSINKLSFLNISSLPPPIAYNESMIDLVDTLIDE